jgi:hypothetical protein
MALKTYRKMQVWEKGMVSVMAIHLAAPLLAETRNPKPETRNPKPDL